MPITRKRWIAGCTFRHRCYMRARSLLLRRRCRGFIILMVQVRKPLDARFFKRTERRGADECWAWTGYKSPKGYGVLESRRAHRVSYELHFGRIPDGLIVCDNPSCVNPAHLWLGTIADNNADRAAKGRYATGESHRRAKLTKQQVEEIRRSTDLHKNIAAAFGISKSHVKAIRRGAFWK